MKKSWSIKGFRDTTQELVDEKKIKIYDKGQIDLLVDAFNRHPWRAAFFVWSTINANARNDFRKWNKDEFIKFYTEGAGIGCFEKVVACFL